MKFSSIIIASLLEGAALAADYNAATTTRDEMHRRQMGNKRTYLRDPFKPEVHADERVLDKHIKTKTRADPKARQLCEYITDIPDVDVSLNIDEFGNGPVCQTGCEGDYSELKKVVEDMDDRDIIYETFFIVKGNYAVAAGEIFTTFDDRVAELKTNHPNVHTIILVWCPGSNDDEEAIKGTTRLHDLGYSTCVPSDGYTASGGTDFFLSGVNRYATPGAKIGIHSWSDDDGTEANQLPTNSPEHDMYLEYFDDICIPRDFYWEIIQYDANGMHYLSENELQSFPFLRDCNGQCDTPPGDSGGGGGGDNDSPNDDDNNEPDDDESNGNGPDDDDDNGNDPDDDDDNGNGPDDDDDNGNGPDDDDNNGNGPDDDDDNVNGPDDDDNNGNGPDDDDDDDNGNGPDDNDNIGSCRSNEIEFDFTIRTDNYGHELSWEATSMKGSTVASGEDFRDNKSYTTKKCIPDNCYRLSLFDSYGDGLDGGGRNPGYSLRVNGKIIERKGGIDFGRKTSIGFGSCSGSNNKCEDKAGWRYKPRRGRKRGCKFVALNPKRRCGERGLDGTTANKSCKCACG